MRGTDTKSGSLAYRSFNLAPRFSHRFGQEAIKSCSQGIAVQGVRRLHRSGAARLDQSDKRVCFGSQVDDNSYYGHVGGASDSRHSSHSRFPHKNQLLDPSAATSPN